MTNQVFRVAMFDPEPIVLRYGNAVYTEDAVLTIEIAPHDDNRVKITVGSVSRIVDGISLCDAINRSLAIARRR